MSDGIYIGMAGAVAQTRRLDAIADNLANAQTPGFKAEKPAFASFLPQEGVGDKVYAAAVQTAIDRSPGLITPTGDPMHVLPDGDLLLGVQLPSGDRAFTRDGRLTVSADGTLLAANGHPLLGEGGGPITAPPHTRPVVDAAGIVRADGVEIGKVALFQIDGPISRLQGSLLGAQEGSQVSQISDARVRIGELELANSSPIEAAAELIAAHRSYDHSLQAIQTYRKLDERTAELGRVR